MPKVKKRPGVPSWLQEDDDLASVPIHLLCREGLRGDSRVLLVLMARNERCRALTVEDAREILHCGRERASRALRDLEELGYLHRPTPFGPRSLRMEAVA